MTDTRSSVRPMSFVLVFVGLLFFANPYFATVDILPDWIGCALIFFGLDRIARISKHMSEARSAFLKLLIYSAAKDVLAMTVFMTTGGIERPTALLIVTFVNAVCASLFTYRAVYALFDGFYALAVTRECPSLYANYRKASRRERSRTEQILYTTVFFIIFREIFAVLPELSSLANSHYMDSGLIDIYEYIGLMRGIAVLAVLAAGVWWLVTAIRYFALLRRERAFRVTLAEEQHAYTSEHPGIVLERRFGVGFFFLALGAFFLCDFVVDMKNIFPDYIAILCILAGLFAMELSAKWRAACVALTALFGLSTLVSSQYATYFHLNHTALEISKTVAAERAYFHMWFSALIEFALFIALLICLLLALRHVIREWAGYTPIRADLEFEQRRRRNFLEEFDAKLLRVFLFGFVSGLFSFLTDYVQEIPDHRLFRILEFMWGIDLVFGAVFAVMFAVFLGNVHRSIRYRFSFDD